MKEVLFYFEHKLEAGFPLGVSSGSDQKFQPACLYSGLVTKVYPLCTSVLSGSFFPTGSRSVWSPASSGQHSTPAVCLWQPPSSYLEQGMLLCREGTDPLPSSLQDFCAYDLWKIKT